MNFSREASKEEHFVTWHLEGEDIMALVVVAFMLPNMQKLDVFEKLEQKCQGQEINEEEGDEEEEEDENVEEEEEEYSDDGDYNLNIDFDDDEDDFNISDDDDGEPEL